MELKELREKLNKKHIKVRVPKIYGESYAVSYAKMLKSFTDNIVENFSGLVLAIYELTRDNIDSSPKNQAHNDSMGNVITFDEAGDFDFWDNFFKEHEKEMADIEREIYGRKRRKSPDEATQTKRAWKEFLKLITSEEMLNYPKAKKEPVDYTSSLSSLFDYYTDKTFIENFVLKFSNHATSEVNSSLLTKGLSSYKPSYSNIEQQAKKELNNLYRYVYGSYKKEFPNLSVSGEYYEQIMNAVINENLTLIKSIPQEVLKEMQVVLSQGIISGNQKELVKNLKRIKGVQKDRAVFIARDQIHKAVESFKQVQNTALGIEYYEWLTAEDERVSSGLGGHRQNNHRIFKYGSNEAIISHSNKRGFYYGKPGDRPNCRCIAVGVILDIDEKVVKSSDGYGYQVVKK